MFRALRPSFRPNRTVAARSRRARVGLELLEDRRLLSTKSTLAGGVLTINADNTPNVVIVKNQLVGTTMMAVVQTSSSQNPNQQDMFPVGQVKLVVFNGGTAKNTFTSNVFAPAQIHGHGVGDVLNGSPSFDTLITEDSSSATINGDVFGRTTFVANSDLFFTLTNTSLTSFGHSFNLNMVRNVVLNLAGPLASNGGGHVDLAGYTDTATVNSQGAVRTDYYLGNGVTTINGGPGLNVLNAGNVASMRIAGNAFTVNGVKDTLNNITNLNVSNAAGTSTIDLNGFAGDTFVTLSRAGNATVRGGSGTNTIISSAGTNVVLPGLGKDLVSGSNITRFAGLPAGPVAAALRNVSAGPATVYLEPNGTTLDVVGPTGVGFSLLGNWAVAPASGGQQTFTATGNVVLHAAAGDLTFSPATSSPLTVTAQGPFLGFGTLVGAGLTGLTLNTSDPSSPLNRLESTIGLHVDSAGSTWNIAMGKDVPGLAPMPLEGAVPYLVATSTGGASTSFAGTTIAAGGGHALKLLLDPSDPSLWVQSSNAGKVELQVAASLQGNLLFTPTQAVPNALPFYGNLFTTGVDGGAKGATIDFGDLRAVATGPAVIDLDVSGTTNLAGVTPDVVRGVVTGQLGVPQAFPGGNVAVGVNGEIRAGFSGYVSIFNVGQGPDYDFTIASGAASAVFRDGSIAFATTGASFESGYRSHTPSRLSYLGPLVGHLIGTIGKGTQFAPTSVQATADMKFTGSLKALIPGAASLVLNNTTVPSIAISGNSASFPVFGQFGLTGTVTGAGDLALSGGTGGPLTKVGGRTYIGEVHFFDLNIMPVENVPVFGTLNIGFNGNADSSQVATARVFFHSYPYSPPQYYSPADARLITDSGRLEATMDATYIAATSSLQFGVSGQVTGTRESILAGGADRKTLTLNSQVDLDNGNIRVYENALGFDGKIFKDTLFDFAGEGQFGPSAFPDSKSPSGLARNGLVAQRHGPRARPHQHVDPPDQSGRGTPANPRPAPGSSGRAVHLLHRYRTPVRPGSSYQVAAHWQDNQGRGNTKVFNVQFPSNPSRPNRRRN
ncbi:MAG: hypothetical protein U0800_08435 [Isosphaeraceae bacterium]